MRNRRIDNTSCNWLRRAWLWGALVVALVAPGTAEASTRSFCAGTHSEPCGGHLEPTCGSSSGCDAGYLVYDIPNITIDCPWPIPDETVTHGCYDPLRPPTCAQCSANGQYQCLPSTGCGGLCDPGLTPDGNGYCRPCGSEGEPICEDGEPACEGSLINAGGTCYDNCGDAGQIVCPNLACQEWRFSSAGICVACGGHQDYGPPPDSTQLICPTGDPCRPNYEQQGTVCSNCGQNQEVECELGDACRDGAEPIGEDQFGYRICADCDGLGQVACEGSSCDAGLMHVTSTGLNADINDCLGNYNDREAHFIEQNGFCSDAFPDTMARPPAELWPAAEDSAAGRNTVLIIHGRGSRCGASMDNVLDTGGVYAAGHLVYCVEYAQEGNPSIDPRAVRILPVIDDVLGTPQACTATGDCGFDGNNLVADVLAPTFDVPGVGIALKDAILQIPIEGDITLIGHSQGGFIARELTYSHYDELRWAGKKISRVITLGHPYYTKHADPHTYTPWLCEAKGDNFDCQTGRWTWGWDFYAPGSINNADYPQVEWTAVSGAGELGATSPEDADGDGDTDATDVQCLMNFGGVDQADVVGDTSVPIESSLGYDEFGYFQVADLPFDRKYHGGCAHTAACMMAELENPVPCLSGSGMGSAAYTCQGTDAVPGVLPDSTDPLRTPDALDFDGVDDRVTIDDPAALAALDMGGTMTLEAWVHPQGVGNASTGGLFINKEGEYWFGRWGDGRISWAIADGNWVARLSSFVLPEDEWSHVALVYDGAGSGLARLYVNGRFVEEWSVGGSVGDVNTSENRLDIGQRATGGQPFDGMIDDVRVWDEALTASEIATVLNGYPASLGFDPVGWWRFDEDGDTVLDSSGNGFHGSISTVGPASTPIRQRTRRTDKRGGALYLDGIDDRAIVSDPAAMARLEMDDELTIEGWMFLRSYDSATMLVSNAGEYWLAASFDGRVGFAVANDSPGWVGVYSDYFMPLRAWTHVAFVYDNEPGTNTGTAKLFINGQLETQWAIAGSLGDVNGVDELGLGGASTGGNLVHGLIDEVRVWNVARTDAEIAQHYNRTLPSAAGQIGLVGYWDFDERFGDVLFDHSGLGNHALLGDGTAATKPYRSMSPHLPGFRLIYEGDCGNAFIDPLEDCDDGSAAGGDGCSATCRSETVFEVMGDPQGGSVSIDVAGVTISVTTTAGQTAADVAAALAAAIQADTTLASLGVTATSSGDQLFIGGEFDNVMITDPGLMDCASSLAFPLIDGDVMNACPATAVLLSTSDAYTEYQWLFEGQPIDGANEATFLATVTGEYRVRVGDGSGCERDSFGELTFVTFCPETEISPAGAVHPLRLEKNAASPTGYYATFQNVDDVDGFHLYEGNLGTWYDHGSGGECQLEACTTTNDVGCYDDLGSGRVRIAFVPGTGNRYYLISGYQGSDQGPAGNDSGGAPRDPAQETCLP